MSKCSSRRWKKEGCYAYVMSNEKSVDIDNALDLKLAEILMKDKM